MNTRLQLQYVQGKVYLGFRRMVSGLYEVGYELPLGKSRTNVINPISGILRKTGALHELVNICVLYMVAVPS